MISKGNPLSEFYATLKRVAYNILLIKQTSKETTYDTAGYENPKPLCGEKGNVHPACWNQQQCRQLEVRATQKLTTAKCLQKNITKLAIKQNLGARMGAEQDWLMIFNVHWTKHIWERYPQFILAGPVLWSVPAKYLFLSVRLSYTVRNTTDCRKPHVISISN